MSALFNSYQLKDVRLRNRVAVPPMCQYSAIDGVTGDWHDVHYAGIARGGAGLVIVEATAVSSEGRITPACTGLWNDTQAEGMARIAASIKNAGAVPGIQIGHAGRKGSANRPWDGDDHIRAEDPYGWQTISPSAIAFGGKLDKVPTEMSLDDINRVQADFVAAAIRARDAGFEWLELHFAHGYLAQSFFSVHANHRTDAYGGDARGRGRFLLETLDAVRAVWPERLPLTARFGVLEFDGRDEQTLAESMELVTRMKQGGLDLLNVSIGFSTLNANVPWAAGFMAPIAARVRREAAIPVATAWGMDDPQQAQQAVLEQQLDLAMMGRAHLADPHYPFRAARELNQSKASALLPEQYAYWLSRYPGPQNGDPVE
ncbi:NADH:flavin oxidoreductase/NADH oxidase [Burkholderia sp. WSM2232]|uniref:NADH:flavin oxidoreductase/NADH oxidase n=1 Tax=Burkholderia sp. WSM2232 TaxID=944436 RepID=UPI00041F3772|nr:NADH:flavin oxidoreductase/NADH oxidase [Burkholderia sp. WSM2232]